MATDYYAESKKLAEDLETEGLGKYANALLDAIAQGSTGTEILMALSWNLDHLIDSSECPQQLKLRAAGLRNKLVKVLRA